MFENDPKVPNFTHLNDEHYSLWVVQMDTDLISFRLYNQVVCKVDTKGMTSEDTKMATVD